MENILMYQMYNQKIPDLKEQEIPARKESE